MRIEPYRITKALTQPDQLTNPSILEKLASQIDRLCNISATPTLFRSDATHPFLKFVIAENKSENYQIVIKFDGMTDAELKTPPVRLIIRLLDRNKKSLTRAIFTLSQFRASNDFDRDENLPEDRISKLETEYALNDDPEEPAWYDADFLREVSDVLEEAELNSELMVNVLNYYRTKHVPPYDLIDE